MKTHSNLAEPAAVSHQYTAWQASPAAGVDRLMLDRDGGEMASRATTIVKFGADSSFPEHPHGGGEEFLVLDGTFSDATGDFTEGYYVRNPVGSRHAPWSREGATIFVKLGQFDPKDQSWVRIDTKRTQWQPGKWEGLWTMPLHRYGSEKVRLMKIEPGTFLPEQNFPGGVEILVVKGLLETSARRLEERDWLRLPAGSKLTLGSDDGALVYVKTGHLLN